MTTFAKTLALLFLALISLSTHSFAADETAFLDVHGSPTLVSKAGNQLVIGSQDDDGMIVQIDGTNIATFDASGMKERVGAVITPSTAYPTPNAGDSLSARFNRVVAGVPTAAFVELPRATVSVGETVTLYNPASNPVAIVPIQGDSINALAAGTPYACGATSTCTCTGLTGTLFNCR